MNSWILHLCNYHLSPLLKHWERCWMLSSTSFCHPSYCDCWRFLRENLLISMLLLKVFQVFLTFSSNIEEYMHIIISVIVKLYERSDGSILLWKTTITTIEGLSQRVKVSDHASCIIHPLVCVLSYQNNELYMAMMDTLCALVHQLGSDFAIFIPTINKVSLTYITWMLRLEVLLPVYPEVPYTTWQIWATHWCTSQWQTSPSFKLGIREVCPSSR